MIGCSWGRVYGVVEITVHTICLSPFLALELVRHTLPFLVLNLTRCSPTLCFIIRDPHPRTLTRPRHPLYPLEDETRPFDSVQNLSCNSAERDGRIGMCEVSRNVCTLISIPRAPMSHSLPMDRALLRNANASVRYHSISYTRARKVNDIR